MHSQRELHVFCVKRTDRTDWVDETYQICPLVISKDRDTAYKRACLYLKEEVNKDHSLHPLLSLPNLPTKERDANEKAIKIGYNGDELRDDYAFMAYDHMDPYDVDFTELKVEECIHVELA